MHNLRYKPSARKYFKKLRDKGLIAAFKDALCEISKDPYNAGEPKIGDLKGIYCYDIFYNGTNYEIAYQIFEQDEQIVVIFLAGTRENFYQELKRYMK
ncbi:MAG: type II toxin-antitoxin system RelE/ParE family toxin [Oscillospiraceae bacterium]|jgi:mRNA-degrading endonuclease RelE of RelBE toxin-antitoxin system|nr:type II toxin-antitoxin system RelE/ParE family toxin [Oscillospiraceae bacterium]